MSKLPIYKRKWFIVVAIIFILAIIGGTVGKDKDEKTPANTESSVTEGQSSNTEEEKDSNIEAPQSTEDKSQTKEPEQDEPQVTTYKAGMYKVGEDITAGEYKIISEGGLIGSGYVEINKNSNGDLTSIIANDNFNTSIYLTIEDGEYLKLQNAYAIPIEEASPIEPVDNIYTEGMYKVGFDIEPGEYKVIMMEDNIMGTGYYEVTNDSRHDTLKIVANDNFENSAYITVEANQYIKLVGAYIQK